MSADDIYARVLDGMGNLTESATLSVIRRYIPYIFGTDTQILSTNGLGLGFDPDFIVKIDENDFAIIEVKNQTPNTTARLEGAAKQLLSYSWAFREAYPTANVSQVLIVIGALSVTAKYRLMELGVTRVIDVDDLRALFDAGIIPPRIAESPTNAAGAPPRFTGGEAPGDTVPQPTFVQLLESIKPGRPAWAQYQKLVGNILEFLCSAPSSKSPFPSFTTRRAPTAGTLYSQTMP